jgi:hypothetical protein
VIARMKKARSGRAAMSHAEILEARDKDRR